MLQDYLMALGGCMAAACGLAGCYLVFQSWREHSASLAWAGWLTLALSLGMWIWVAGSEYGLVYGIALPALLIWPFIYRQRKQQAVSPVPNKAPADWRWRPAALGVNVVNIIWHLVILMFISCLIATAISHFLPISVPSQMATGIILVPLIWAALSVWTAMAENKHWPVVSSLGLSAASAVWLFLMQGV